jgi:hypothetical protein
MSRDSRVHRLVHVVAMVCACGVVYATCTQNGLEICFSGGSKLVVCDGALCDWEVNLTAPASEILWCTTGYASGGYTCENITLQCKRNYSGHCLACGGDTYRDEGTMDPAKISTNPGCPGP